MLLAAVRKSMSTELGRNNLYLVAVLKYWVHYAAQVTRRDVINVLLTMLLIGKRRSVLPSVFVSPISLRKGVDLKLFDEPKGLVHLRLARMHPFAQLQSTMVFARVLYRMLQEPLGDGTDCTWEFFSERVFHHLAGRTESEADSGNSESVAASLDFLMGELLDEENKKAFEQTVDLIWDAKDRSYAKQMLDKDSDNADIL
ncbi:hypothetical protein BIW11_14134 [Tropilaelaps mercedesae]|uniref:Uncharacterized protein n=1 Tax=Tropilaelaps mercedesae TaxID=418985 RepID=A0A1V9WZ06_9ACAR|nr:hypothetical protein BIW11_14134 [Tropilaelaps mercedesae]